MNAEQVLKQLKLTMAAHSELMQKSKALFLADPKKLRKELETQRELKRAVKALEKILKLK